MKTTPDYVDGRPDWVPDTVFYQVFPDRFANGNRRLGPPDVQLWGSVPDSDHFQGGDLAGVLTRLGYLADLGVTGLWLNPIFEAGTNHRYDTHDYLRIDHRLGDEGLLKEVVQEAHRYGIRVLLDGVFNHCGDGFWAFQDLIANGESSAYRDWFFVRHFPIETDPPSYQTCGGAPYLPKLNTANPEVRSYLLEVASHWVEIADIDGWRLDVPWKVPRDFWEDLRAAVRGAKPDTYLVGEIWRDAAPWLDVFDGAMNYRLRDVLLDFCIRDHLDAEDAALEIERLLELHAAAAPWMLNLLGSHDTARVRTVADGDDRRVRLAQVALLTLPGAPLIYYGDELGLEGGNDPGCRGAMPADVEDWGTPEFEATRQLVAIRHAHPALRRGSFEPLVTFNGVLAYRRLLDDDEVIVVLNPRGHQRQFTIPTSDPGGIGWQDALTGRRYASSPQGIRLDELVAGSAVILVPVQNPRSKHAAGPERG